MSFPQRGEEGNGRQRMLGMLIWSIGDINDRKIFKGDVPGTGRVKGHADARALAVIMLSSWLGIGWLLQVMIRWILQWISETCAF